MSRTESDCVVINFAFMALVDYEARSVERRWTEDCAWCGALHQSTRSSAVPYVDMTQHRARRRLTRASSPIVSVVASAQSCCLVGMQMHCRALRTGDSHWCASTVFVDVDAGARLGTVFALCVQGTLARWAVTLATLWCWRWAR